MTSSKDTLDLIREQLGRLLAWEDAHVGFDTAVEGRQTYLRELVLAADHAAYHIGELVLVRRPLGAWKS